MQVSVTPNGKFFVFSLLDHTIKVCYMDSMRLLLNLYGHSLPVLTFDIASDSGILATGSADKSIKIWGMDFGDIHKSLLVHTDSVTCVKFVPNSHYLWTASKDKSIKMLDCDTYETIFIFDCFFGECWALTLSSIGDFLVVGSGDNVLRTFIQSES